ncbi:hypothetical protein CAL12_22145 [Bordetella genomosp. 8]|uniref:ANTAR domain-containing protein n=1 Tax=Bordetella genomosp. 8 TaxID=1416806 RepID=A0A1W6YRM5_9BORD|nr:hypothetical protein [Bordetella genomosp. 8]ARP83253.1 hypothetical protein CAL12_22145 [Bordetella genomosp. 8]
MPPEHIDVAEILALFGCAADEASRLRMHAELDAIQKCMLLRMRTPLRPQEFAKAKAMADASISAREILAAVDAVLSTSSRVAR